MEKRNSSGCVGISALVPGSVPGLFRDSDEAYLVLLSLYGAPGAGSGCLSGKSAAGAAGASGQWGGPGRFAASRIPADVSRDAGGRPGGLDFGGSLRGRNRLLYVEFLSACDPGGPRGSLPALYPGKRGSGFQVRRRKGLCLCAWRRSRRDRKLGSEHAFCGGDQRRFPLRGRRRGRISERKRAGSLIY